MLKGKVALITGATTGMGRCHLEKLLSNGAAVMFNGFPPKSETIPDILTSLKQKYKGSSFSYHSADMSKPEEIHEMVQEAVKNFGRIDILYNNAGIAAGSPFALDTKFQNLLNINLIGPIILTQKVVPLMVQNKWGRILNISSILGVISMPGITAYSVAKHGLIGLTKGLALELAPHNITVNAICPGFVRTRMVEEAGNTALRDELMAKTPTKRLIEPEEVAELALFLCGDSAKNMTGASYLIDGGYTAQ